MVAKTGIFIDRYRHPSLFVSLPPVAEGPQRLIGGYGSVVRSATRPRGAGAFYAPDFHLRDPAPWWVPEHILDEVEHTGAAPRSFVGAGAFSELQRPEIEGEVTAILSRIAQGEFQKVVPVWFARSRWSPTDEETQLLIRNARTVGSNQIPYGLLGEREGMVGVTPEILFRVDSAGVLTTMALAGTQRNEPDRSATDLLADPKERGEHQLVIDFICGALTSLGAVSIGPTTVREVPGLRHLYTPITLHPTTVLDFEDLVRRLHPTPALGAVPREAGGTWLVTREALVPRGRHGAPFGVVLPNGEMICLVAIRNIQWNQSGSMIGAGCGIVAGSTPAGEYREATAKIASVQSMLGIPS